MKKLYVFLLLASSFVFISCNRHDDDIVVPAPILGQVFEANVTFSPGNNFSRLVTIPNTIEVFESDVILVYWLEDVVDDGNGGSLDVWSQVPQTIYIDEGSFQYNFNHTFLDVLLFLQGDFDLNILGSGFTDNQIFRIAILPAEFADSELTMDELLQNVEIEQSDIQNIEG